MKRKFLHKLFSPTLVIFVAAAMSVLPSLGPISYVQAATLPAFPGAEGWGAVSVGGRGGKVIEVTTLADAVPAPAGSLRACAEASGPRTCVFRVGGTIELSGVFRIDNPYLTIAGQTAPGGGILIKGFSGIRIQAHDVIIRYLRFRLLGTGSPASGQVNIGISTGAYNVIVDHCSTSWSLDENMQIWKHESPPLPDITNITVQRCLIAEGLAGHNTGLLIGGTDRAVLGDHLKVHEISAHHNLFVHNYDRNPRVSSAGTQVINNVVYNWGSRVGVSARDNTVDVINNYWKPGLMSGNDIYIHESTNVSTGWVYPDPSIYIAGNIVEGSFKDPSSDNWVLIPRDVTSRNDPGGPLPIKFRRYTRLPQAPFPIAIQSATDAYTSVLADAGANARLDCQGNWVPNSDAVDKRLIADVKNGTGPNGTGPGGLGVASPQAAGGFPNIASGTACSDTDHDGMPDEWEGIHGFSSTDGSDGSKDADGDGYTNVEEYLNGM
jgi:pectate lyase